MIKITLEFFNTNLCIRSRILTSVVKAFRIFPRKFDCNNGKHKFHKFTQPV